MAVVAPGGALLARCGDPRRPVVVRSAAKPFQALPLVLAGGVERLALAAADLALICSSHSGTAAQRERAADLLARGGFSPADLQCGPHRPFDETTAASESAGGEAWTPLHNNCSGKHAGMLLACRLLGLDPADYLRFDHPLQRRIREELAGVVGVEPGPHDLAIDGCSAPTFALPLAALARGYAALADPGAAGIEGGRAAALGRLAMAMGEHPEMVAGPERFTSELIRVTGGRLVGKEGAEGVYGVAIRGPQACGLALKIADGAERARDTVVIALLRALGVISGAELAELARYDQPVTRNHRGLEVGRIEPEVDLTWEADET